MNRILLAVGVLLTSLAAGSVVRSPGGPAATSQGSPTLESYRQARALVQRAMDALGGPQALAAARRIVLEGNGRFDDAAWYQGVRPDTPDPAPFFESLAVDTPAERAGYESRYTKRDGTADWLRFVYEGGEFQVTHLVDRFAFRQPDPAAADIRPRLRRMVPHLLLAEALSRPAGLRYLGRAAPAGEPVEMASVALPTGEVLTLHFSPSNGLLLGFEYLADALLLGEAVIRWRYLEYRPGSPIGLYPSGYRLFLEDRLLKEVHYNRIGTDVDSAQVFQVPPEINLRQVTPNPQQEAKKDPDPQLPRVTQIAPGVFFVEQIRGGFHTMFVEFQDFLVVFEAPTGWLELHQIPAADFVPGATSTSVSEDLIELVKKTVPGKPIRYLVLSHFHSDHAGGWRAFSAEGATILAGGVTRPLIEELSGRTQRLHLDHSAQPVPRLETVSKRRIIEDASNRLELIEMAPNQHAEGMLVGYLPEHRLLFVADLFLPTSAASFPLPSHLPMMRSFVSWLDEKGLQPETVLTTHGSGRAGPEHLEKIRSSR